MTLPALTLRNLRKTYANGFEALRGIDLEVADGEFFALLGPNGAGKSTTIGIASSLVRKTSGSVKIFGHDLDQELSAAKHCIGLVPQEFNFNNSNRPPKSSLIRLAIMAFPDPAPVSALKSV